MRGRPRQPELRRCGSRTRTTVSLPVALWLRLDAAAASAARSLSDEVEARLAQTFAEPHDAPPEAQT